MANVIFEDDLANSLKYKLDFGMCTHALYINKYTISLSSVIAVLFAQKESGHNVSDGLCWANESANGIHTHTNQKRVFSAYIYQWSLYSLTN